MLALVGAGSPLPAAAVVAAARASASTAGKLRPGQPRLTVTLVGRGVADTGSGKERLRDVLRQIGMKTKPGRLGRNLTPLIIIALAAVCTAACSSSPPSLASVPAAFRHACGHPGAKVTVSHLPVTIKHSACNLTGVSITVRGGEGAVVPESGGVGASWDGIDSAHTGSLTITVADGTRDVTITGTGSALR
jgi:hypothetical protein